MDYAGGTGPFSVALGDLDGDQDLDIVVAAASVMVLRNLGNGAFSSFGSYSSGGQPFAIAMGDLDGDQDLDLAVANRNSDNVGILLNNSDGTFAAATNYAAGDNPRSVALGDVDLDQDLDVVLGNEFSVNVTVRLNAGDGTFAAATNYATGAGVYSVAVADLNEDGYLDIAAASAENVIVFLNDTIWPPLPLPSWDRPRSSGPSESDVHMLAVTRFIEPTVDDPINPDTTNENSRFRLRPSRARSESSSEVSAVCEVCLGEAS